MQDPIIGVDTEWKPDTGRESNDVALIQFATPMVVVLLRTCQLGGVPEEVIDFCL